jgi:starvation-inducible DNA-binding protein
MNTFRTHHDLPESTRIQLGQMLNLRLAEAVDLSMQCKHAHWNVKGPEFIALHKLFDEVYEGATEYVDLLAERIVQLGGVADGSVRTTAQTSTLPPYPRAAITGTEHIEALSAAVAHVGKQMRRSIDACAELGDQGSADLCTEISRGFDKWLWFLEAHVQSAPVGARR